MQYPEQAPEWFSESHYIEQKVRECSLMNFQGNSSWTAEQVLAVMRENGQSPWDNFRLYGDANNVSPNELFNVGEYLTAKANQLQNLPGFGGATWTPALVLQAFKDAGMSAWEHYTTWGQFEGINPSNAFDTTAFWNAKLQQLNNWDNGTGYAGHQWTMESMQFFFRDSGLNPIMNLPYNPPMDIPTLRNAVPAANCVSGANWVPWGQQAPNITLEPDQKNFSGTADSEIIHAVVGGDNASLFPDSKIDGGSGNNTLDVALNAAFTGFDAGSGLANIENVVLTNNTTGTLEYNATNANGVRSWTLNEKQGSINLTGLQEVPHDVSLQHAALGTIISFSDRVAAGSNDAMILNVMGLGAVSDENGQVTAAPVQISAIENLTLNANGANHLDLSPSAGVTSLAVMGSGSADIAKAPETLVSFTAKEATGNVKANIADSTHTFDSITMGSGDDEVSVANLTTNAAIDGGSGFDTLVYGGQSALVPTMRNVEKISFTSGVDVIFNAQNVNGLGTVAAAGGGGLTMNNFKGTALTVVDLAQAESHSIALSGNYDITYQALPNAGSAQVTPNLESDTRGGVSISTLDNAEFAGDGGIFNLPHATNLVMNAASEGTMPTEGTIVKAPETKLVSFGTWGNGLEIHNESELSSVTNVNLYSDATGEDPTIQCLRIAAKFPAAENVRISGNGNVWSQGQIGDIDTKALTIDASNCFGTVNICNGTDEDGYFRSHIMAEQLTYNGGYGEDNLFAWLTGTGSEITVNGGGSQIGINSQANLKSDIAVVTVNAGIGQDSLNLMTSSDSTGTLFVANNMVGGDTVRIGTFAAHEGSINTAWTAQAAAATLAKFGITGAQASDVVTNGAWFTYGGNTYMGSDCSGTLEPGAGLVQLTGVTRITSTTINGDEGGVPGYHFVV